MILKRHLYGVGYRGVAALGYFSATDPTYANVVEELVLEHVIDDTYRIQCIPFYLNNVNYLDLVQCVQNDDGLLRYSKMLQRSDWFSFRVFSRSNQDLAAHVKQEVRTVHGEFELYSANFYAVSVKGLPLAQDIGAWLAQMEAEMLLNFDTLDSVTRA